MMADYSNFTARGSEAPRLIGFRTATLRGDITPAQSIVIRNLSCDGIGAKAENKTPMLGETVVVTIEKLGEFKAMVKWVSRDLFGLHLISSLSSSQLEAIRDIWNSAVPNLPAETQPRIRRPRSNSVRNRRANVREAVSQLS
jgi:hypothetical protein